MASILTEIYVSIDNLEFTKLDLYKDEKFVMKFKKTDSEDISKVFTPFSQSFTFPATPKNKKALGYFGNTEVIKINTENKLFCKIYTSGNLNQTGVLTLENVKYKNGKADNFAGGFSTNMISLKDRIRDDTLNDLGNEVLIDWTPSNVFNRLKSNSLTGGLSYYVPLISNSRVWNYNNVVDSEDNIFYKASNSPTSNRVVNVSELRPCVSVVSLLNIIKTKYNLTIITPLESRDELSKLNIWCNNENFTTPTARKFVMLNNFSNEQPVTHGKTVTNITDSSLKITKNATVNYIQYRITFKDLFIGHNEDTANLKISIYNKSTGLLAFDIDFEVSNGDNVLPFSIPLYLFTANEFEFFTYVQFDKPVFWKYTAVRMLYRKPLAGDKISTMTNNYNSLQTGSFKVDLIKSLPDMKIIDFITSYFKMFNISIYDSSPNTEDLYFLTTKDIDTSIYTYSKKEVDYTQFTNISSVSKTALNNYNYYSFSHLESSYRSNIDFKKQFGTEYGQAFYPLVKPEKAKEFKVETKFSIIPPVKINGTSNTITAYGFTADSPEITGSGIFRYTPNNNEPTLFYNSGTTVFSDVLGCQNFNGSGLLVNSPLDRYIKSTPFCSSNNNSLGFSILVNDNISYPLSLFSLYYATKISRLLNPNALKHVFKMKLPSSEIYLNDNTTLIPSGFRLQNEVIIGETRYETLEGEIDQTTGESTLTLLNI